MTIATIRIIIDLVSVSFLDRLQIATVKFMLLFYSCPVVLLAEPAGKDHKAESCAMRKKSPPVGAKIIRIAFCEIN